MISRPAPQRSIRHDSPPFLRRRALRWWRNSRSRKLNGFRRRRRNRTSYRVQCHSHIIYFPSLVLRDLCHKNYVPKNSRCKPNGCRWFPWVLQPLQYFSSSSEAYQRLPMALSVQNGALKFFTSSVIFPASFSFLRTSSNGFSCAFGSTLSAI